MENSMQKLVRTLNIGNKTIRMFEMEERNNRKASVWRFYCRRKSILSTKIEVTKWTQFSPDNNIKTK